MTYMTFADTKRVCTHFGEQAQTSERCWQIRKTITEECGYLQTSIYKKEKHYLLK